MLSLVFDRLKGASNELKFKIKNKIGSLAMFN